MKESFLLNSGIALVCFLASQTTLAYGSYSYTGTSSSTTTSSYSQYSTTNSYNKYSTGSSSSYYAKYSGTGYNKYEDGYNKYEDGYEKNTCSGNTYQKYPGYVKYPCPVSPN